jgi:hypothetical protein
MLGQVDDQYWLVSIASAGPLHCDFAARVVRATKAISQPHFLFCLFCFVCFTFPVFDQFGRAKLPDARQPPASEVARADISDSIG